MGATDPGLRKKRQGLDSRKTILFENYHDYYCIITFNFLLTNDASISCCNNLNPREESKATTNGVKSEK